MSREYIRYNKTELASIVSQCLNFSEVARRLGKKPVGGTLTNMKLMCKRWKIDISHMTGSAHLKGKRSSKRKDPHARLVMGTSSDHRVTAYKLRTALLELGVEHKCNVCSIEHWNNKKLVLEIDHIDGCYWNNTKENLQFLCPNCHSQK